MMPPAKSCTPRVVYDTAAALAKTPELARFDPAEIAPEPLAAVGRFARRFRLDLVALALLALARRKDFDPKPLAAWLAALATDPALAGPFAKAVIEPVWVPFLEEERCVVIVRKPLG